MLTCSAGIGANRMIAKICSDINKPNGQTLIPNDREQILKFIAHLPLRKIPHIGGMTETTLNAMGITTLLELRDKAAEIMIAFAEIKANFLVKCSLGLG